MNSNDYKECENPDAQNLTEKTTQYHIDIGRGETHSANEKPSFIHPDRLTSLFKLGMQAQKDGDLNDAIVLFSRIIELDGRNESAIFQRGRTLAMQKQHQLAIVDFDIERRITLSQFL